MILSDVVSISIAMLVIVSFHTIWVSYGLISFKDYVSNGIRGNGFVGFMMWLSMMGTSYIVWWLAYCTFRFLTGL
jgi:hypothetical protein